MMSRYLFSSAFIHASFLALLVFMQGLPNNSGPSFIFDGIEYIKTDGGGHGKTGVSGLQQKFVGQIVSQPPIIKVPDKVGPPKQEMIPKDIWNTERLIPPIREEIKTESQASTQGPKIEPEQNPIVRVGVSPQTVLGGGTYTIGIGKGGIGNGIGDGIGDGNGPGFGFSSYLKILRQRIWSEWAQSIVYGSGDVCVIGLTVSKDGGVSEVRIEKPSGNSTYDDLAMRAIRNASPLPPLPTGFPKSNQRFRIQFRLLE